MRAAIFKRGGELQVVDDFPLPVRKDNELLIKVAACSVNPVDIKLRKFSPLLFFVPYPKVTGSDGAGVVVATPRISKFKPGDQVCFMVNPLAKWGLAAEMTVVAEENAALVQHTDIFSAAAIPLVANTAWQALQKSMPLSGKHVLVQAGSGGVGSMAVQIASALGAHVTTTSSHANLDLCKSLGAKTVVDYRNQRFEDVAPPGGFDCVLNTVDGDYNSRSLQVTKHGGHFSQVMRNVASPSEWAMGAWGKALVKTGRLGEHTLVTVRGRADLGLQQTIALMGERKLKPLINTMMPLNNIIEAHNMVEKGAGRGKVVVKLVDSIEQLLQSTAQE